MNLKYAEMLVTNAKSGNQDAKEKLIQEFKPFIYNLSKKTYMHGYNFEDIESECNSALLTAIEHYDLDKRTFVSYATSTIKHSIYHLILNFKKSENINGICSLTKDGEIENIELCGDSTVESIFFQKNSSSEIKKLLSILTNDEKELIDYVIINGHTLQSYATLKNMKYSKAYCKKQSLINKIKKLLKDDL